MRKEKLAIIIIILSLLSINLVGAEMLISDAGVEYDSEIISAFNSSEWVRVFITLKDNITNYTDYVKNEIPTFLSENEFKIKYIFENVPSLSAEITKEGLDKIINNSDVAEIGLVEKTYTSDDELGILSEDSEEKKDLIITFTIASIIIIGLVIFLIKKKK